MLPLKFHEEEDKNQIKLLLTKSFLILLGAVSVAYFITPLIRNPNNLFWHSLIENMCILILLGIFLAVWCTYEKISSGNRIIGLGFLIVAIIKYFDVYNYIVPGVSSVNYDNLIIWHRLLGRFIEALVLLLGIRNYKYLNINKWLFLSGIIVATSGVFYGLTILYPYLPLLHTGQGIMVSKSLLQYLIIGIFISLMVTAKDKLNHKGIITYKYIFISLSLIIGAEICFIISEDTTSFFGVLGHLLNVANYFYLLKGIFASVVVYPYERIQDERKEVAQILSDIPMGVVRYDENYQVQFANTRAKELLGTEKEKYYNHIFPRKRVEDFFIEKGLDSMTLCRQLPHTYLLKDMLETHINVQGMEIKLKMDLCILNKGYVLLFEDVRREQSLEILQNQTQTILNSIDNLVIVMDRNNKIIMCNEAFAQEVEISTDEIVGKNLSYFNELSVLGSEDILRQKDKKAIEISFETPNGLRKELLVQVTPIKNLAGEYIGKIGVATDLTELKNERCMQQQSEKLVVLGQMAAGIVHEIKNPLTTIKGFSQIICLRAQDEKIKEFAHLIDMETDSMNQVVNDFLRFSKPRSSMLKEVRLSDLVDSMKLLIETNAFMKKVKVVIELERDEKLVRADSDQLKQVVLNMVQNSLDAMSEVESPQLQIKTGFNKSANEMFLSISDNGVGMSLEEKIKIGTPFFTTKSRGTGLGLTTCYQIIKDHGGRLDIDSVKGKGTTMTIFLSSQEDKANKVFTVIA